MFIYPLPVVRTGFPLEVCQAQIDAILVALNRALESGVVEYHIGSRGLKRFTLKELQDYLTFWLNRQNDAALGIAGSSIQSRRAIPCDA